MKSMLEINFGVLSNLPTSMNEESLTDKLWVYLAHIPTCEEFVGDKLWGLSSTHKQARMKHC